MPTDMQCAHDRPIRKRAAHDVAAPWLHDAAFAAAILPRAQPRNVVQFS